MHKYEIVQIYKNHSNYLYQLMKKIQYFVIDLWILLTTSSYMIHLWAKNIMKIGGKKKEVEI